MSSTSVCVGDSPISTSKRETEGPSSAGDADSFSEDEEDVAGSATAKSREAPKPVDESRCEERFFSGSAASGAGGAETLRPARGAPPSGGGSTGRDHGFGDGGSTASTMGGGGGDGADWSGLCVDRG